jgi:hypothetical protein
MEEDVKQPTEGQATSETESSPVKTEEPALEGQELLEDQSADKEIADELLKDESNKEGEDSDEEAPEEEKPEEETPEDDKSEEAPEEPKKGAEARKEQLQTEIRELVAKRNELRDEVSKVNSQVYAPQTAEELVAEGMEPAMARVEALEQKAAMAEFNAHVADLNANLNVEALQVMSDFPVFNPDAPEYDKSLAERAKRVYERAAAIETDDKTGLIVNAQVLPYEIYKEFAEAAQAGKQAGAVKGQIAAEKNLAAVDPVSSSAPSEPKEDLFLKGLMSSDD